MKTKQFSNYLVVSLLLFVCTVTASAQEYNRKNLMLLSVDELSTTTKQSDKNNFTYKNLRLYPIKASKNFLKASKNMGKYTSLKKALKSKKVIISEQTNSISANRTNRGNTTSDTTTVDTVAVNTNLSNVNNIQTRSNRRTPVQQRIQTYQTNRQIGGGGPSVNNLMIENVSKDTLYIMAGEIVQGGKQDRVIAQDMVIPPNSGKINLSVFCVEHGRWSYKKSKDRNKFDGYYGVSSLALRKVVDTEQSQSKVWNEVERSNKQVKVKSSTQAYTAQKQSSDFKKKYKAYRSFFSNKFDNENNIVGVVVVTGNRVVGCDIFASPALFKTQFNALLGSYINEAITDGAPVSIKRNKVEKYMYTLLDQDMRRVSPRFKKNGKVFKHGKRKLHVSKY